MGDDMSLDERTIARLERRVLAMEAENERLKRGDFTPEEFQNLCHNREAKEGCTEADFFDGCHKYQNSLFQFSERDVLSTRIETLRAELAALRTLAGELAKALEAIRRTYSLYVDEGKAELYELDSLAAVALAAFVRNFSPLT